MSQGFIKVWRSSIMDDLGMPDVQYKVWMVVQMLAIHSQYRDLKAGQLRTSYRNLQNVLTRNDGSMPSETTIRAALVNLVKQGYIQIVNDPGRMTVIGILRWSDMQGKHPEGHEWQREANPESDYDGYGIPQH
jgi:hypothetical protein